MSLVVDAHQHFWTYGTYQTSWMDVPPYAGNPAFQTLRRSFQPDDLMPELTAAGVHCTVTIEAADNLAENEALLANSHTYDWPADVRQRLAGGQPTRRLRQSVAREVQRKVSNGIARLAAGGSSLRNRGNSCGISSRAASAQASRLRCSIRPELRLRHVAAQTRRVSGA